MASVQAESLEVLEKADFPSVQARAVLRAIELEIGGARDVLATKSDLTVFRDETRHESQSLRSVTGQEIESLRQEARQEFQSLRRELQQEIEALRHETKQGLTELSRDLAVKIESTARSNMRLMYTAMLTQMGVLVGLVLSLAHAGR